MDANLKYELATRYMKSKETKKAIPFAAGDGRPGREPQVRVALGKCFIAEKQLKLARYRLRSR